jgi:hypothetical protein
MSVLGDIEGAALSAVPGANVLRAVATGLKVAAVAVPCIGWAIAAHTVGELRDWQGLVVAKTSAAAHLVDKAGRLRLVAARDAPAQIEALGAALDQVRAKTAQAAADDAAHAAAVQADQDRNTKEQTDALQIALADARARAADYARRLRAAPSASGVAGGDGGTPAVPAAADAAGTVAGAGEAAVLAADASACAEAVTKAQGWQDWWMKEAAVPR